MELDLDVIFFFNRQIVQKSKEMLPSFDYWKTLGVVWLRWGIVRQERVGLARKPLLTFRYVSTITQKLT